MHREDIKGILVLCTTLLCPAWGQTLPSALEHALGGVGTTSCPVQSSSRGQFTPGGLEGTCFGQLLEKKAAWKGRRAKPRGDTSLSCPAGSQKAAAETKPTARSSCPGKEACSPYQQLRRLRQQTSCPRPSWRGSKMQSSALSPFSPGRFMTSA